MSDLSKGVAIGIDAGGTKTLAVLVDREGREIARARSAGGNPWDVGPDAARAALNIVLNQLMIGGNVRAVCLGAAGIDSESDRTAAHARLRAILPRHVTIDVRNDAAATLGLVGPQRPAMVVVADTGSIAYGESGDGRVARAGGHGAVLGDCASAVALGMAVLRHTADVLDSCEPKGALAAAAIDHLRLERATDIVARIRHPDFDEPLVESLGALLHEAASAGDVRAHEIVGGESATLARNAACVAKAIRSSAKLPVLLVGCVFAWLPEVRQRVVETITATGPVAIVESGECVHGAARIAAEMTRDHPLG